MPRFRTLRLATLSLVALIAALGSCSKIDNSIGAEFIPGDQELRIADWSSTYDDDGTLRGKDILQSRLFRADSISTLNLTSALMGSQSDETFGTRSASFFSEYLSYYHYDEDLLAEDPTFDSIRLYYTLSSWGGDTTKMQSFEIYEVIDNSFLNNEDIAKDRYFSGFKMPDGSFDSTAPIFTFSLPNQSEDVYTNSAYVNLEYTPATEDYLDRLVMRNATADERLETYGSDSSFVNRFKGFYIKPAADSPSDAAILAANLENTGFVLFGHTMKEDSPSEIADTVAMMFQFAVSGSSYTANSISMVENDYSNSKIDISQTTNDPAKIMQTPTTATIHIEGWGGVVGALSFSDLFFNELDEAIAAANLDVKDPYTSVFFNQAKLIVYLPAESSASYKYSEIDPLAITPWLNDSPSRLGLYTNYTMYKESINEVDYSTLVGIGDYNYLYEDNFGYELEYGGYLNRSWGAYVMNIPSFLQSVWNNYTDLKSSAAGGAVDINDLKNRTFYIAPVTSSIYGFGYGSMQGGVDAINNAPVRMEVTYTLIK